MKKLFFFALAAMAILVSCSEDEKIGNEPIIQNEEKATLILKMSFPRTYANNTATTQESTVNNVDVFIFDAISGAFINHKPLLLADFTQAGNVYTTNAGIITTSGSRKIGIGINLPADIVTKIITDQNLTAVDHNSVHNVTAALIATGDRFIMYNTAMPTQTLVADDIASATDNHVAVDVERMAGKAALATTSAYDSNAGAVSSLGSFTKLEYKLMQTNLKSYLMREPLGKDPNYLSANFTLNTPSGNQFGVSDFEKTATYKNLEKNSTYTNHGLRPAFYGAENTADFYQKGSTTYFMVKGQFTPTVFSSATGTSATVTYTVGSPFWVVSDGVTIHICASAAIAEQLKKVASIFPNSATVTEYPTGDSYYAVFIGNASNRAFVRNNYYVGQVKAINGFGSPTETGVIIDPTAPVDGEKTTVEVAFTVLPWTFNLAEEVELK